MHPDVMPADAETGGVWQPWHFSLGDHWATINYLITRSFVLREEMLLSRYQHGIDFKARFTEMLALIAGPERSAVTVVDAPGTRELNGFDVWASPFWPTANPWRANERHQGIVCQFDGISSAESKNPPPDQLPGILRTLSGYAPTLVLGKTHSLTQITELMRSAKLFVGVCSGMSHLAHSTGIPMVLVEYKMPIITCHRRKHFVHTRGTEEMLAAVRSILGV